ncbi:MAG: adenylosuccinate lyase [Candidatus Eisenbacteria bacterium]|uniref:Adenylosuccinate lyase n=1 Tax=Eiseniibacteriota bacterium TaxID=2212470 RepID=A0A948RWG8_UNCEI|nr:adenylosuccinate lyase [Candidatus Eisenbacteria bacterium]MBU1947785.1 adenylosuccinate lyase [Candidatus Eisenbacteria bacterium]MBU2690282.1 adenylosuccinate lyase [Candidatus Eisenbacteria bacterium]
MIERYSQPEMAAVWSTKHRLEIWLRVELALVETLEERGTAPPGTADAIRSKVVLRPERVDELEATLHHDVIAFLTSLTEQLGPEGATLHFGMTSSDLLDTALSLQCLQACDLIEGGLAPVLARIRELALKHKMTVMVGRTHGVHAEPTTFGLKMLGWYTELLRQQARLREARAGMRVGKLSGAVGTLAHLPPEVEERTLERLGLAAAPVSTQIVQRDRHAHLMLALAQLAASLEKFATEIRNLQRTEIREAQEPFGSGQKGSSAMPHKRNPILCERISGIARLLRGYAIAALENVALWHERDISHSSVERVILPDAFIIMDYALNKFCLVMNGLVVDEQQMRRNLDLTGGLVYSQKILLALTKHLGSREKAYAIVQDAARMIWDGRGSLKEELMKHPEVSRLLDREELDRLFEPEAFLHSVDAIFARTLGKETQS